MFQSQKLYKQQYLGTFLFPVKLFTIKKLFHAFETISQSTNFSMIKEISMHVKLFLTQITFLQSTFFVRNNKKN